MEQKRVQDAEVRKKREAEDARWLEQRRKKESGRRLGLDEDLPDMDLSELVEAEMSGLPIDEAACSRLRQLPPDQALELLKEVSGKAMGNVSHYIQQRVNVILGQSAELARAAGVKAKAAADELSSSDSEDDDDDPERIKEESEAVLPLPVAVSENAEPSDEQLDIQRAAKREAAEALETNDVARALEKYTEVMMAGGCSALMLAKRAELQLRVQRPCGAIRDCDFALKLNGDCGKAYRIRGIAYRKLGHWREANSDLVQGQRLDFDEGAAAKAQQFVAAKVRTRDERKARKREARMAGGDSKRPRVD